MSISTAKKFVLNFYCNPILRIKIAKTITKDLDKKNKLDFIILTAKKLGYNFTKKELQLANKINYYKLNENDLQSVRGGININENLLNEANLKLKNFLDII